MLASIVRCHFHCCVLCIVVCRDQLRQYLDPFMRVVGSQSLTHHRLQCAIEPFHYHALATAIRVIHTNCTIMHARLCCCILTPCCHCFVQEFFAFVAPYELWLSLARHHD